MTRGSRRESCEPRRYRIDQQGRCCRRNGLKRSCRPLSRNVRGHEYPKRRRQAEPVSRQALVSSEFVQDFRKPYPIPLYILVYPSQTWHEDTGSRELGSRHVTFSISSLAPFGLTWPRAQPIRRFRQTLRGTRDPPRPLTMRPRRAYTSLLTSRLSVDLGAGKGT